MLLKGKYTSANVFTDKIDSNTVSQIIHTCNNEIYKDSRIAVMPDTHAGKNCVVGLTIDLKKNKIVQPELVGADIGCGMLVYRLKEKKEDINLKKLDSVVHAIANNSEGKRYKFNLDSLKCENYINKGKDLAQLGTLGNGNHFIELDEDEDKNVYLIIHSGSRHLGSDVCRFYCKKGKDAIETQSEKRAEIITTLTAKGKQKMINDELKKLPIIKISKEEAYVKGQLFDDYLHDIRIVQNFATLNRKILADKIVDKMAFIVMDGFETIHNYIDIDNLILRKGAISAQKGERVLIPFNLKDGCIIATGLGNEEWNFSAPHGAGRVMSRSQANTELSDYVDIIQEEVTSAGVYTTSLNKYTIDEAPEVYKSPSDILNNIVETVEVTHRLHPIFSFKNGKEDNEEK